MATLFHVTGGYTYVDPYGKALGYEDVFTKLENVRRHYERIGLGADYANRFVKWHYLEHDWIATAGDYAFEPPGETHTLIVPGESS